MSINRSAFFALSLALAISGGGVMATAINCASKAHLSQAAELRGRALKQIKEGRFKSAAKLLRDALAILEYRYGNGVQDDSGTKLSLAVYRENRGDFRSAATIRRRILDDRLRISRESSLPPCRSMGE